MCLFILKHTKGLFRALLPVAHIPPSDQPHRAITTDILPSLIGPHGSDIRKSKKELHNLGDVEPGDWMG
jgi:hypothetical protein